MPVGRKAFKEAMKQELVRLTEEFFLWPHHPDPKRLQPCIGVIVGERGSILVDAGNSPELGNQLKGAMKAKGLPDVSAIIYTHNHWDHISGACAFEAPAIAHVLCRDILLEEAKKPWGPDYIRQEIIRTPKRRLSLEARQRAIRDWRAFRFVIPDDVFETSKLIRLESLAIELRHVGGAHSEDSIIVKIPEAGVMFLGDCYFPAPAHLRTDGGKLSIDMLQSLVEERISFYIDSHNDPFTKAGLLDFIEENQ